MNRKYTKRNTNVISVDLGWERPKTERQEQKMIDCVEIDIEVNKKGNPEWLARNMERYGDKTKWTKEEWDDLNDKNGNLFEYGVMIIHFVENTDTIDKIYLNIASDGNWDEIESNIIPADDLAELIDIALKAVHEERKSQE